MEVFITVVNNPNQPGVAPTVLGTFRTGEATMFSWDVAVQKARTALYYSSRDLLGFGRNIAMSTRTVGFLAQSHYPPGIDADHAGPFFGQQEMFTCLSGTLANVSPISGCSPAPNLPNGITIFPGRLSALSQWRTNRRDWHQRRRRRSRRLRWGIWDARTRL